MRTFRIDRLQFGDAIDHLLLLERTERGAGVHLRDQILPVGGELYAEVCKTNTARVVAAELVGGELQSPDIHDLERVVEGRYYGPALVHICPPAFPEFLVKYNASTFSNIVLATAHSSRVTRQYHPIGEAVGVDIVALSADGQEGVFVLLPRASLMIRVDEVAPEDVQTTYTALTWDGSRLFLLRNGQKVEVGALQGAA